MVSAAQVKPMAVRVGERVGFDPLTILTIIQTIIGLLQSCKKPASKAAATAMIDDEFSLLVARKRADKCPLQFRKVFRDNGISSKDDMNDCWEAIVHDAAVNRQTVSTLMVS